MDESQQQDLSSATTTTPEAATVMMNRVRLFGSSWTSCGYCHGERASTAPGGSTSAASSSSNDQQQQEEDEVQEEQTTATTAASSKAYSIIVFHLTPALYEAFIERGWRRSGRSLYKPDNAVSCCPLLSIRLPVQEFQASKSQRKLSRRMERLLLLASEQLPCSESSSTLTSKEPNEHKKTTKKTTTTTSTVVATTATTESSSSMSEILEQLESWTNEALQEILATMITTEEKASSSGMIVDEASTSGAMSACSTSFSRSGSSSSSGQVQLGVVSSKIPRAKFTFRKPKKRKAAKQKSTATLPDSLSTIPPAAAATTTTTSHQTAVTSVCAAIAGQSKGKIDRSTLSLRLVEALQNKATNTLMMSNKGKRRRQNSIAAADEQQNNNNEPTQLEQQPSHPVLHHQSSSSSSNLSYNHEQRHHGTISALPASSNMQMMMIQSIERHEPSGQVLVHIQLPTTTSTTERTMMEEVEEEELQPMSTTTSSASLAYSDDKLAAWWENESKRREQLPLAAAAAAAAPPPPSGLTAQAGSNSAPVLDANQQQQRPIEKHAPPAAPPLPPLSQIQQQHRKLTVETMPAHQSALDPQVHRLYAYYQHAVHQDPDPFILTEASAASTGADGPNSNDDGADKNNNHDSPWWWGNHDSTSGTSTNAATTTTDSSSNEQASSTTSSSSSSLRSFAAAAPTGWVQQLFRVMSQTYSDWPEASQRKIMSHFGQFYDFLVDHPFCNTDNNATTGAATGTSNSSFGLGVHHQQYRINGYLIAVGVVDILPRGLSSVYLFYDPSFSHHLLPLGTFSSLREIAWTRDVARLPNYYLGYYIHSCTKMRYKANYRPSQLLCPETYQWVEAKAAQERIERLSPQHHCCRLVPADGEDDDDNRAMTTTPTTTSTNATTSDSSSSESRTVMEQELQLEVGFGHSVHLHQLHESARSFLRPFLQDFIQQAGPAIGRQCVIDFR